ncbi:hypothetical protein CDD82_1492 [Ophiocordyceps australis]|uniref:MICOS complex subunit MIC12 n=1 Tax=Ophiocordyceps australis TaxID=1399860 RepID=A0A2C5ZN63_9HYPO|nr:hypothetical protein CDD82_1492 [Ophiocordyceps australis]
MGFVSGFTGGVTLTLSLAYLSIVAHQRNRQEQCRALREQAIALESLFGTIPPVLRLSRAEIAARERAVSIEGAKDRWNEEVENAVRWMQSTDWQEVRLGLEDHIAALWISVFGESADAAQRAGDKLQPLAAETRASAQKAKGTIASAAKGAFDGAKEAGGRLESTVEDKALEAKRAGKDALERADAETRGKVAEAQSILGSAFARGRDMIRRAVGMADGEQAAAKSPGSAADTSAKNAVEKALRQRFEKRDARLERTAADVLKERYMPMDQRDNTVLRGV